MRIVSQAAGAYERHTEEPAVYEELTHEPCYVCDPRIPWNIEEPRREELRLLDALDGLISRPEHLAIAVELVTQIARAQSVQGRHGEANDTLYANERRLSAIATPIPRIRQLLERGRLVARQRIAESARLLLGQAYNAAREADEVFLAIDAAHMLSLVEPPKQREAWLDKATELAEKAIEPSTRRWIPALELARGWRLLAAERGGAALEAFDRAVAAPEVTREDLVHIRALHGRARALRSLEPGGGRDHARDRERAGASRPA